MARRQYCLEGHFCTVNIASIWYEKSLLNDVTLALWVTSVRRYFSTVHHFRTFYVFSCLVEAFF